MELKSLSIILAIIIITLTACDTTANGGGTGTETGNGSAGVPGGGSGATVDVPAVTGLQCSVFTYKEYIKLSWDHVPGASGYKVYRYTSKADSNPKPIAVDSNSFSDQAGTEAEVPYFYKVSALKGSSESKKSPFALGMRGSSVDSYEISRGFMNNDHRTTIAGQSATERKSTLFSPTEKPLLYSIPDGAGGVSSDSDWYLYKGPLKELRLEVKLQSNSSLKNGDLKIQFYYQGKTGIPENIIKGLVPSTHRFSDYGTERPPEVEVYYRIYVDPNSIDRTKTVIEEYIVNEG